jgi:hypothetical protein
VERYSPRWNGGSNRRAVPPRGSLGPRALAGLSREELVRLAHARPETHEAIRAELERRDQAPALAERFPAYHADERAGDGVGDDEASQLRWQSANPSKARARRRAADQGER